MVAGDEYLGHSILFVCEALDADEYCLHSFVEIEGRERNRYPGAGPIVYVRLISGALPSPIAAIQGPTSYPHNASLAHIAAGAFAPATARLKLARGRVYETTLLGSFQPLNEMEPSMRAVLRPTCHVSPDARPVILESMLTPYTAFRPRQAQLIGYVKDAQSTAPVRRTHSKRRARVRDAVAGIELMERYRALQNEITLRQITVGGLIQQLGPDAAIQPLLSALNDEIHQVRETAAYQLGRLANRIPLAIFLDAIGARTPLDAVQERSPLNAAVCEATVYMFYQHVDEVPVQALLDLYHGMYGISSPTIHATAISAMGRLAERVTDEVVETLAGIVTERRAMFDVRVRSAASKALETLGPRAPVEALIAGLRLGDMETAPALARALLRRPAAVPAEILEEARLLSDDETARQVLHARIRERAMRREIE